MANNLEPPVEDNPEWHPGNTRVPSHPSEQLRAARATLGLTQDALAGLLGVPAETLRDWEHRRREPDDAARTLIRLLAEHPRQLYDLLQRDAA